MLHISWTEYKTNVWTRQKILVSVENGLLKQLKKRKLTIMGTGREEVEGWLWQRQREKLRESVYPVDREQRG